MTSSYSNPTDLLHTMWEALGGAAANLPDTTFNGEGALRSKFALTDLAVAGYAAVGSALSELVGEVTGDRAAVRIDRRVASASFELPPRTFLPLSGPSAPHGSSPWFRHYRSADDRWLWVQAGFPTPRARLLHALGVPEDPEALAAAMLKLPAEELEQRVTDGGGVVAIGRTAEEWLHHPQGVAVGAEPLVHRDFTSDDSRPGWKPTPGRPLAGLRVLDLTRVVAGPTGTRLLAAAGAEVLRIDAPNSDESQTMLGPSADNSTGKRWAFLDLKSASGRERFLELLATADVLTHSYRPGALDALVGPELRAQVRPGLIEVTLDAYGWTGPWRHRRGFDTIVQFSTGLADETTAWALEDPERRVPLDSMGEKVPADRPRHLPVEAIDLLTGYLFAASTIRAITHRLREGQGSVSKLSLARTAALIRSTRPDPSEPPLTVPVDVEYGDQIFVSNRGPSYRMPFPVDIAGNPLYWERPTELAGSSSPVWSTPDRPIGTASIH